MSVRRFGLAGAAAIAMAWLSAMAACTDGTTPDCSDAQCGAPAPLGPDATAFDASDGGGAG